MNFQMFKLDLEKAEESEIKLQASIGSSRKQESSRKTSISAQRYGREKGITKVGFLGGSDGKASARNAGDLGSIPGLGRSLGGGPGNPFQRIPVDRGA